MSAIRSMKDVALSYPLLPLDVVDRSNFLRSINQLFDSGSRLVCVEGEPDIGKTTLLAQFVASKQNAVICFFVRPISDMGYDPSQFRFDLCNQVSFALDSVLLDERATPSQADARAALLRFVRRARVTKKVLYFVIDGLADIPERFADLTNWFVDIAPLHMESFRVLVSGDSARLPMPFQDCKTVLLSGFTPGEVESSLLDVVPNSDERRALGSFCEGNPGRVQSVKRLLSLGQSADDILNVKTPEAKELLKLEWSRTDKGNTTQQVVLTLLAFFPNKSSIRSLSELSGLEATAILKAVETLPFVRCDQASGSMMYASETVRKFAQNQLEKIKNGAFDVVISNLRGNPTSSHAVVALPELLHARGDRKALVDYLSTDVLARTVLASRSIISAIGRASSTNDVAHQLGDQPSMWRLSIQEAALRGVLEVPVLVEQINFAIAESRVEDAIRLANSNPSSEIRLRLLSVVARHQFLSNGRVTAELSEEIERLEKMVQPEQMGDAVIDIASNLLLALPKVSTRLVQRQAGEGSIGNSLDVALTRLSLRALRENLSPRQRETALKTIADVASPSVGDQLAALTDAWVSDSRPEQLLESASKIEHIADRLLVVRGWLERNASKSESVDLALMVAKQIASDTLYSPNAGSFTDLVLPALRHPNLASAEELINLVRHQMPHLVTVGPTNDLYRLRQAIATFDCRTGKNGSKELFDSIVLDALEIKDPTVRATVLSGLFGNSECVDATGNRLINRFQQTPLIIEELKKATSQILSEAFDHDVVLRGTLRGMATCAWHDLKTIVDSINTQERRDAALRLIVEEVFSQALAAGSVSDDTWRVLREALNSLKGLRTRDATLASTIRTVLRLPTGNLTSADLRTCSELAGQIGAAHLRARACARLLAKASPATVTQSEIDALRVLLLESIESVDGERARYQIALECYSLVRKESEEHANVFIAECRARNINVDNSVSGTANISYLIAALACRAYVPLALHKLTSQLDWRQLCNAIQAAGSNIGQLRLWSMLLLRARKWNAQLPENVFEMRIVPLVSHLRALRERNALIWNMAVVECFPAYWLESNASARALLDGCAIEYREKAIEAAINFIAKANVPGEAFSPPTEQIWTLDTRRIDELLELALLGASDETVYDVISVVYRFLDSSAARNSIPGNNRGEIASRLNKLAVTTLPSRERHIRHDGYLLLCRAESLRYEQSGVPQWEAFLRDVEAIPNVADRVYVYTALTRIAPKKLSAVRESAFSCAQEQLACISAVEDRLSRAIELARGAPKELSDRAKQTLHAAFGYLNHLDDEQYEESLKAIIDTASAIDEPLARTFASLAERDPARRHARQVAERALADAQMGKRAKRGLADTDGDFEDFERLENHAWKMLGEMNATQTAGIPVPALLRWVRAASRYPLEDCIGVMSLAVTAIGYTYKSAEQVGNALRPALDALFQSYELVEALAATWRPSDTSDKLFAGKSSSNPFVCFVGAGERVKAEAALRSWLSELQPTFVYVCDAYLSTIEDFDVVRLINDVCNDAEIVLLVGSKFREWAKKNSVNEETIGPMLTERWGDGNVPYFRIISTVGVGSNKTPIHDRWWITNKGAIDTGTSFNAIGGHRVCRMRLVALEDVGEDGQIAEELVGGRMRQHHGEWLSHLVFTVVPTAVAR